MQTDRSSPPVSAWLKQLTESYAVESEDLQPHNDHMSTPISREELDAKLAANVAEVKATAADMRAEMVSLRLDTREQLASIQRLLEVQAITISASFSTLNAKIDGVEKGMEGKIDGLKSSISMGQWAIGILVAIGGIWLGYLQLKQAQAPATAPTVATTPSQQATTTTAPK